MAVSSNLSTLDVSNAINQLTVEETRDLVFQMGVPLNVLKDIAAQYDGENRKQNFVQTWLDRNPDASWEKLVAGLRKINKNSLAAEIESEHLSRALVPHSGSPSFPSTAPASASPSEVGTTDPISNDVFCQEVVTVKVILEQLQDEFYEVMTRTHSSLSDQEKIDNSFLDRFRDYLLVLPVAKRQVHIRFFIRNEDEILAAETIKKLFAIVSRYCNYTNYEIIFHIVKRFCHELKRRMLKYRDSLTSFEKSTAVDVYLSAISAHPGGAIRKGYIRMTMKINKPPSECKLYEIRELKESIEENAALESHATYIETPLPGSVVVRLLVPEEVGWRVGVVLMSPAFREKRLTYVSTYSTRHLLKDYLKGELQVASGKGDVEAVISLSAVADPYWIGVVTMMMAVEKFGNAEVISRLLQPGANIDVQDKEGNSLLMIATRMGWTDVVSLLINAGAALDLQNKEGDSAVILATTYNHLTVLKEFVRAGADFNLQNEDGLTALMISSRSGRADLTETLLLGENISLDIQATNGWSALFFAADNGDTTTTELLVKAGANPHLRDHNGLTALDFAVADGHRAVCRLLRKYMQGQDVRIDEDSSGSTASLEYVETASTTSQESGGDTLSQGSIGSATNSQESKPFADKSEVAAQTETYDSRPSTAEPEYSKSQDCTAKSEEPSSTESQGSVHTSAHSSQEPPSETPEETLLSRAPQALRDRVKNARAWVKAAFKRLQDRVSRSSKKNLESEGQSQGEEIFQPIPVLQDKELISDRTDPEKNIVDD